jgi:hypothetical protein
MFHPGLRIGSACALFTLVSACSDLVQDASPFDEKQARCDLRPVDDQCTDIRKFKGPSLVTFQGVCSTLKASKPGATGYAENATCPSEDMWGGCQTANGDGSLQTNWFYKGDKIKTEADAKAKCDDATWVAPQ